LFYVSLVQNKYTALKKFALVNLLFFCFHFYCCSQTARIDSIKLELKKTNLSTEQQFSILIDLCNQFPSLHPDSMALYVRQAMALSTKSTSKKNIALCNYFYAIVKRKQGDIDSAIILVKNGLSDEAIMSIPEVKFKYNRSITGLLIRKGQLKEALENAFEALQMWEKLNNIQGQVDAILGIGWVYMELNQNREAINWFLKGLSLNKKQKNVPEPAVLNSNLAAVYSSLKKNDSASIYVNKAILLAEQAQDLTFLCNAYYIYSDICIDSGNYKKAELLLKNGIDIRRKIGDPFYIVSDIAQLGKFYTNTKQYQLCNTIIQEGLQIANKYHLAAKLLFLNTILAENYKASGNYLQYSNTLNTIVQLKDTLYEKNSAEAVRELQTKYEVQKKENTIVQQRLDLVEKSNWMFGIATLLVLGGVFWYFNYSNNKRKQQQQIALALVEEKRATEKAVLLAQELERKRIAADLHDNLGAYAAAIAANVDTIKTTFKNEQQSLAVEELYINSQAIVSQLNDTIWVLTKQTLSLTAISDRLKIFIQRLQNSYPTVQIDVHEMIEHKYLLAPIQALQLFKILQEAIINALRHSNCTTIDIAIQTNGNWSVAIADDGNGIEATKLQNSLGGHGLFNMRKRSEDAGWTISWLSNTPRGTIVSIYATTN
jgi:signal transduction histidine kinase